MTRKLTIAFLVGLLFLVQGCATFVVSKVTVFHKLPENPTGNTTYAFLPIKDQKGSLEYETYKNLVRQKLALHGYEEVGFDRATGLVVMEYFIGTGKEKVGSIPIFGQTGVSSSSTFGTVSTYGGYGTYSGYTTYTPTWGVVGSAAYSYTQYPRSLFLQMVEKETLSSESPIVLYEAKVFSEGSSGQIAEVMPEMIEALFKKFPGKSGSTRTESITFKPKN